MLLEINKKNVKKFDLTIDIMIKKMYNKYIK